MKRIFTIVAALCMSTGLLAQITLTYSDFPVSDESFVVSSASDLSSIDYLSTGANFTWDFSSLAPDIQDTVGFISPTSLSLPGTYIIAFNNSFTDSVHDASVANFQYYESPMPTITFEDYYNFYKVETNGFIQVGIGMTVNSAPLPILWNPTDTILPLPASFGDVSSCFSAYNATIPTIGYYSEERNRNNSIDGWGTLITPFGTFDALRVVSYSEIHDSLYYEAYGIGFPMDRTETEYKWYAHGYSIPVMKVVVSDGMSASIECSYIDSLRNLSVNEIQESILHLFPVPATETISFPANMIDWPVMATITDLSGRVVFHEMIQEPVIDVSKFNPGYYHLQLLSESKLWGNSFIKE